MDEKFSIAADAQAFFARMASLRGDKEAERAHWDLAITYQNCHINRKEG